MAGVEGFAGRFEQEPAWQFLGGEGLNLPNGRECAPQKPDLAVQVQQRTKLSRAGAVLMQDQRKVDVAPGKSGFAGRDAAAHKYRTNQGRPGEERGRQTGQRQVPLIHQTLGAGGLAILRAAGNQVTHGVLLPNGRSLDEGPQSFRKQLDEAGNAVFNGGGIEPVNLEPKSVHAQKVKRQQLARVFESADRAIGKTR